MLGRLIYQLHFRSYLTLLTVILHYMRSYIQIFHNIRHVAAFFLHLFQR